MLDPSRYPLLQLIRQGSPRFDASLVALVAIAGLANAALLAIVNGAAENASNALENGRFLALFVLVMTVYIITQRHILLVSIEEVERLLDLIRVRISDRIRRSELLAVERMGRTEIYAGVNRETQTISQAASTIIVACQSALLVLFSVMYLAWVSMTAFVLTVIVAAVGMFMHFRRSAELNRLREESVARETHFFDGLTHLLEGFKEVKISEPRSADLFQQLQHISRASADLKIRAGAGFAEHFVFAQAAFYLLIGAIVFVLPRVSTAYTDVVTKSTTAILFIIGPLGGLISSIPAFANANVAAQRIARLEEALMRGGEPEPPTGPVPPPPAFTEIVFRDATFQYADERGVSFSVGPVSLKVTRGETLFIVGGNGSGKSTFLKLLTGLYHPHSGTLSVDGQLITAANLGWYRARFSTIFSDYHLFDRLYGLPDVDPDDVTDLLRTMELDKKTAYVDGRFTSVELSSGQRKRLALVVALLEDRPVLVFDEWAADQDPPFRQYFYRTILRDLKARGKTIVAVTHDDRYFDQADRVLKMDFGQFVDAAAAPRLTRNES